MSFFTLWTDHRMGDLISRASHISISRNKSDLLHRRAKSERSGMNNPLSGRSPDRTHESIRLKIRRRRETLAQRAILLFGELMRTRKVDQSVPESGFRSLGPLGRRYPTQDLESIMDIQQIPSPIRIPPPFLHYWKDTLFPTPSPFNCTSDSTSNWRN